MLPWGGCSASPWVSGWVQPHLVHIYPVLLGASAFWTEQGRMIKDRQKRRGVILYYLCNSISYYSDSYLGFLFLWSIFNSLVWAKMYVMWGVLENKKTLSFPKYLTTEVRVRRKQKISICSNFLNYLSWHSYQWIHHTRIQYSIFLTLLQISNEKLTLSIHCSTHKLLKTQTPYICGRCCFKDGCSYDKSLFNLFYFTRLSMEIKEKSEIWTDWIMLWWDRRTEMLAVNSQQSK